MNRLWQGYVLPLLLAGVVWFLAVHGYIWLAALLVIGFEWPSYQHRPRQAELLAAAPRIISGLAAALSIGLLPRAASQLAVAVVYLVWRVVIAREDGREPNGWVVTIVSQIAAFEALFLWPAIGHPSRFIVIICLFASSFVLVYGLLQRRGERAAAVLAATWAVVAAEAAWVFLSWLVSYVIAGGYFVVPQPTIVLGGLGYCAGSIYLAGKRGELSRARLGEYMIITFVLIIVVVAGTGWRGTI